MSTEGGVAPRDITTDTPSVLRRRAPLKKSAPNKPKHYSGAPVSEWPAVISHVQGVQSNSAARYKRSPMTDLAQRHATYRVHVLTRTGLWRESQERPYALPPAPLPEERRDDGARRLGAGGS
jgi:hypothetical protein